MGVFRDLAAIPPQQLFAGYAARAVHGERLTLAIVEVEAEADLPQHQHENEQLGLVIEGSLTLTVGGETRTVEPGGTWCIPGSTPHRAAGGPEGAIVLDVFAPVRADWREIDEGEPTKPRWPRLR